MAQQGDLGEKISKLPKEAGEGAAGEEKADQEIGAGEQVEKITMLPKESGEILREMRVGEGLGMAMP